MNCPRDSAILASNDVDEYRYYSCAKCRGVWIPGACMDRAMEIQGVDSLPSLAAASTASIRCPGCGAASAIVKVKESEIDVCRNCHGIWIDGDEILRIEAIFPKKSAILLSARTYRDSQWTDEEFLWWFLGLLLVYP